MRAYKWWLLGVCSVHTRPVHPQTHPLTSPHHPKRTPRNTPGKFFKALGNAGVNVLAISQGSSERIISAVVKGSDSTKSLRAVHAAFLLSNQVRPSPDPSPDPNHPNTQPPLTPNTTLHAHR